MNNYKINEIFYSLQGEGINSGKPVIFIRFAGCNLDCSFCDTDKSIRFIYSDTRIINILLQIAPQCKSVIFTGGEPLLQLDSNLINKLKKDNYWLGLETNGTIRPTKGLDYITVSPKENLDYWYHENKVNELRVPFKVDKEVNKYLAIKAENYCISPIFGNMKINKDNLKAAIDFCLANPQWRLSVQNHKLWEIR